ncbi:hypothetical protein AVEN_222061-1 [Araneus ventricosus]|uniref:Uncharacterized protein n=1 Tax=Araneus ventricosus TaxID=182803 RepID=A0A4Y2N5W2_ARAVE|nr:hypothetical protein AVEN_222061-1 [Araneus ventricosus]
MFSGGSSSGIPSDKLTDTIIENAQSPIRRQSPYPVYRTGEEDKTAEAGGKLRGINRRCEATNNMSLAYGSFRAAVQFMRRCHQRRRHATCGLMNTDLKIGPGI